MDSKQWIQMIGYHLGIQHENQENTGQYTEHVIFSAISAWFLTALHDGDGWISIDHVNSTTKKRLDAFMLLYPESIHLTSSEVLKYIWCVHRDNGYFLHKPFFIRPPAHLFIGDCGAALVRGMFPAEKVCFTGLMPYCIQTANGMSVSCAFDLPAANPEAILNSLWEHGKKELASLPDGCEFLNIQRRCNEPYYLPIRKDTQPLTIIRKKYDSDTFGYYLLWHQQMCRLTADAIALHQHQYAQLAIFNRHAKQRVQAVHEQNRILITFSFRLPEPDLRFFRGISWPFTINNLDACLKFYIASPIFPIVQARLQLLDFELEEYHAK